MTKDAGEHGSAGTRAESRLRVLYLNVTERIRGATGSPGRLSAIR
jgi:hypothetical protein